MSIQGEPRWPRHLWRQGDSRPDARFFDVLKAELRKPGEFVREMRQIWRAPRRRGR